MRFGLDTSVLVRLLTGEPAPLAAAAARRVVALLSQGHSVVVVNLVIAETYFALQHHYGLSKADAIDSIAELLRRSGIRSTGNALEVLEVPGLATAKPGLVDRLVHAESLGVADRLLTFERSASRLGRVEVLAS